MRRLGFPRRALVPVVLAVAALTAASAVLVTTLTSSNAEAAPSVSWSMLGDGLGTSAATAHTTVGGNRLLVALVAADGPSTGGQTARVSGGGLSWVLAGRENGARGVSEVWTARTGGATGDIDLTAVLSVPRFDVSLTVVGSPHAVVAQSSSASGVGPPAVTVAAPRGAAVLAVGNDWDRAVGRGPVRGQSLVKQKLDHRTGDTFWVQSAASRTASPVRVVDLTPSNDRFNLVAVVLATKSTVPSPSPSPSPTPSPTASATPSPSASPSGSPSPGAGGTPPVAAAPGKSWTPVFADEFNGIGLDTTKWSPCFDWNYGDCTSSFNSGEEHYLPAQVQVHDGVAHLVAQPLSTPRTGDGGCYYATCTYKSGLISTARPNAGNGSPYLFTYTYGYAVASLKIPATQGFFTAWWMLPNDPSFNYHAEIDDLEVLGNDPHTMWMHYDPPPDRRNGWTPNDGDPNSPLDNGACPNIDYSKAYHQYGVDWEPDHVAFYIDGTECGRYTDTSKIWNGPMQLILDLMVNTNWERDSGHPLLDHHLTAELDADYVRVFQQR